ncbi:hypothetical protein VCRA2126O85_20232 [Vibrio crassostreae]|nr:hypothetical protein VCRA2126O86_20232 [Vibrio crassostreae]CAK2844947.1 hypothetical protein VCRA2127O91_20235 [Vibrio crassostreae]CAK2848921.1 hypothetical protein VCRA2126O85_20232 [Vibrio crassostreae]CAK2851226.1 hypothetical protein VCRA2125O83_20237 [Vibrio crassostreae]CAK2912207.1 hypothetical protein VCRA2128O100_30045 [Vibrio crassostreae]
MPSLTSIALPPCLSIEYPVLLTYGFGALTINFSPLSSGVIGKGFGSAAKLTAETKLKDKVAIRMRSTFKVSVYSL